jgi:hypothetical protein
MEKRGWIFVRCSAGNAIFHYEAYIVTAKPKNAEEREYLSKRRPPG